MRPHFNFNLKNSQHLIIAGGCALGLLILGGVFSSLLNNGNQGARKSRLTSGEALTSGEILQIVSENEARGVEIWKQVYPAKSVVSMPEDDLVTLIPLEGLTARQATECRLATEEVKFSSERGNVFVANATYTSLDEEMAYVIEFQPDIMTFREGTTFTFQTSMSTSEFIMIEQDGKRFFLPDEQSAEQCI